MVDLKAEIIDSANLRIVLTAEELERNGFTFAALNERDPKARAFLLALSRAAGLLLQFDAAAQSIHIEAYPYIDGGCLLCVSRQTPQTTVKALFADSFEHLIALCTELLPIQTGESAVYRVSGGYVLLTDRECPASALNTHSGFLLLESENAQQILSEHAELLIGKDAVGILAGFTRAAAYGPSSSGPDC